MKDLAKFFDAHKRIAIAGGPKTGKTTLAKEQADRTGHLLLGTDDYMHLPWGQVVDAIFHDPILEKERWIIEGVQVPRLLRAGLPADAVLWLEVTHEWRTDAQESMAKACRTVFDDWLRSHPTAYLMDLAG